MRPSRSSIALRDHAVAERLASIVVPMLLSSPFASGRRWAQAIAVLEPEGARIAWRADFASFLDSNDLRDAARECRARKVPPGCVLVWLTVDAPDIAGTGFLLLDVEHVLATRSRRSA